MNSSDRATALAVLRHLVEGAQVDGVRFGPVLQLLITNHSKKSAVKGQVYINLESRWEIFDALPQPLPNGEHEFRELTRDEELWLLCSIREAQIDRVDLGGETPHLMLVLEGGRVLFLNGHHDQYEPWQCGVALGDRDERWLVVACPGGDVAVWAPPTFRTITTP